MSAREPEPVTDEEAEVVDALPMADDEGGAPAAPAAATPAVRGPGVLPVRAVPVVQAAAVAATGFAAGAMTAAVVRGVGKRRGTKAAAKRQGKGGLPVLGTRSFLVDVHLLGPKD